MGGVLRKLGSLKMREALSSLRMRRGASIVIALGMIAVIMFFTIGIATTIYAALQNTSNSKKALQSEYAARTGIEETLYKLSEELETPLGGTIEGEILIGGTESTDGISVDYEIVGQDTDASTVYLNSNGRRTVPVMGRGDAGYGCDVAGATALATDFNHPCNWNKIYYGESIDVPLYVVIDGLYWNLKNVFDSAGRKISGKKGLELSDLDIYVRPACVDPTNCGSSGRYEVIQMDPEGLGRLIVAWQVAGQCYHGEDVGMLPCGFYQVLDTAEGSFQEQHFVGVTADVSLTDDSAEAIDFEEQDGLSSDFLFDLASGPWSDVELHKPVLKLSFITEAYTDTGGGGGDEAFNIPYFEYQVRYKSAEPLASAYSIFVDGYSDNFRYSITGVQDMHSGLFDFAVQN